MLLKNKNKAVKREWAKGTGIAFLIFIYFSCIPRACGVLVSRRGIEPMPLTLEVQSLKHWTSREGPGIFT